MVCEKTATHQVKTGIAEGQCQRIPHDGSASVADVGGDSIEKGDRELNALSCQRILGRVSDIAGSCRDLKDRKRLRLRSSDNLFDHSQVGVRSTKPAIEPPQICQGGGNFFGCSRVGVEEFGAGNAFHGRKGLLSWGCPSTESDPQSPTGNCQLKTDVTPPPVPLPAAACCKDRCSTHCARSVRRVFLTLRCARHAERQCDPHCARSKHDVR